MAPLSRRHVLGAGAASALLAGGFALPVGSSARTADRVSTLARVSGRILVRLWPLLRRWTDTPGGVLHGRCAVA